MIIFDDVERLKFELLALGQPLPDRLSIRTIAELWTDNKEWQNYHVDEMLAAFNDNALKGEKLKPLPENPFSEVSVTDMRAFFNHDILIHRDNFLAWLEIKNVTKPTGVLLEKWWIDSLPTQQTKAQDTKNIKKQTNQERESQLHQLIWRVYQHLSANNKRNTAQAVWNEIRNRHNHYDEEKIIQDVDQNEILWISAYGNESKLKRSTFDKTLSRLKKNHPL